MISVDGKGKMLPMKLKLEGNCLKKDNKKIKFWTRCGAFNRDKSPD